MDTEPAGIIRTAEISPCGRFRFSLRRQWGDGPLVAWLMLNPSTADAERDDPTLRRIQDWASRWGYHGVIVVNVFPFRASKPSELWAWLGMAGSASNANFFEDTAACEVNRRYIQEAASVAAMRMVGFGADVGAVQSAALATALEHFGGDGVMCTGNSQAGWPKHPMARGSHRVPDWVAPVFWTRPEIAPGVTP